MNANAIYTPSFGLENDFPVMHNDFEAPGHAVDEIAYDMALPQSRGRRRGRAVLDPNDTLGAAMRILKILSGK